MKPVTRGYIILTLFLVVGAVVAWHILLPVTCDNMVMRTTSGEGDPRTNVVLFSIAAGVVCGCCFALLVPRKFLLHVLVFSALAVGLGFAVMWIERCLVDDLDALDNLYAHTKWCPWIANSIFWIRYWIDEGVYYWLIPQLIAQVVTAAVTAWIKSKFKREKSQSLP